MAEIIEFLSPDWIMKQVEDNPKPLTPLGEFTYYRTYSRWLDHQGRREYWYETVKRAIEYNMSLAYGHYLSINLKPSLEKMKREARVLFDNIYNARQMPSGRTLWLGNGNTTINKEYPSGNFNCAFTNIEKWEDISELMYLLMVGTGIGLKSTKQMAMNMEPIKLNFKLINEKYNPLPKEFRQDGKDSYIENIDDTTIKIVVVDSKEGWVTGLSLFLDILTDKKYLNINTIIMNYDNVRPKGERLKTFGGTASGAEPLLELFEGIENVLQNKIDPELEPIETDSQGYGRVRPIHILDIANLIGNTIVVGGVRRTAELFMFEPDDYESMFAKYGMNGLWTEEHLEQHKKVGNLLEQIEIKPKWFDRLTEEAEKLIENNRVISLLYAEKTDAIESSNTDLAEEIQDKILDLEALNFTFKNRREGIDHRRMSNNSIAFVNKPSEELMDLVFEMMQMDAEPGFVNLGNAARKVLKTLGINNPTDKQIYDKAYELGLNPCVEIILHSKNFCNLTTVNIVAFVKEDKNGNKYLDEEALFEAQRLSSRMGLRMTLVKLELPEWDKTQQRDRLTGTSVTGWKDAMDMINCSEEEEDRLKKIMGDISREEGKRYASELRVNAPMFSTAIKPEGTLSQVMGGVSSGLHWSHSPYYIRRIRINSHDPLARVAEDLDWTIHAEVGTNNFVDEENLAKEEQLLEARTLVIDFPVESGAKVTKDDVSVDEQFDNYFGFQDYYTDMNTSNTITVKEGEWKQAQKRVWDGWDNFIGVSFLAHDGGSYTLAPYEAINKEEFESLRDSMNAFEPELLHKYEEGETELDVDNIEACASGICPIR